MLCLDFLHQKGGKETILEEELEFKGIEEGEEEESLADTEMNVGEGEKEKGEKDLISFVFKDCKIYSFIYFLVSLVNQKIWKYHPTDYSTVTV